MGQGRPVRTGEIEFFRVDWRWVVWKESVRGKLPDRQLDCFGVDIVDYVLIAVWRCDVVSEVLCYGGEESVLEGGFYSSGA